MQRAILMSVMVFILWEAIGQKNTAPPSSPNQTTSSQKKSSFSTVFEGSPGKAGLYSLLIPGAGQIYNKRWWKAPIVWGAEGVTAFFLIDRINTFNRWDSCYKSLLNGETNLQCGTVSSSGDAFRIRQSARSNREIAWVIMGLVHFLNAVEAFIDRHLINFDTSENLGYNYSNSIDFFKEPFPSYTVLRFRVSLNK